MVPPRLKLCIVEAVVDEIGLIDGRIIAESGRLHAIRKPGVIVIVEVPQVKMWVDDGQIVHKLHPLLYAEE
jgi:hypothetical protein